MHESGVAAEPAADAATADEPACLELPGTWEMAPMGRHFVADEVRRRAPAAVVDDAVLVAGELLANAQQHGRPPVKVCVLGGAGRVRVEVCDGSPRAPVRLAPSTENMTGRGLTLIEAVAVRWGVDALPGGGKCVWADLSTDAVDRTSARTPQPYVAAVPVVPGERLFPVVLGDVSTALLIEAKAQMDNIVRELSLAGAAGPESSSAQLAPLIETVVHGFSDARNSIKRQALAAAERGEDRTRLVLQLPATAAQAGEAYLAALDEADEYSRAGRLLTLETEPDHRLFRRWYVQAVVAQIRDQVTGRPPRPARPFEDVMIDELRRLAAARRSGERAALLYRVTAALAQTRTPEDVAAVVVSEGVQALGATGGGLLVPAPDGRHLAVPGTVGYAGMLVDALREELLEAPLPAATALRTGQPVWLETQAERDAAFPALRGFESDTVAMCAVPLVVAGSTIGALRFSFGVRKLFDEDERGFVLALAAQTAQTLQRTDLYQRERAAALQLQRALLPQDIDPLPGLEAAAFYSPAGDQEAGGDFYDVLRLRDGRVVAFIGDVMGRGLDAAAAMAEFRSTVRAYAVEDPDPVNVTQRIDDYFVELDVPQLVTMLYLLFDPEPGEVRIGNAGHLAPMLVTAAGECRTVSTELGTPYGAGPVARRATTLQLDRGDCLVGFTDGLVERRNRDIDEGITTVRAALTGAGLGRAQQVVDRAVAAGRGQDELDDDVTVLAIRRL